ncbi:MAG: hypothetical protein ACRBN8_46690 [Nannocystales bacterium]
MFPIPWPQLLLAGIYGTIAAAMVIAAILVLPALCCFERGRQMLRAAAP